VFGKNFENDLTWAMQQKKVTKNWQEDPPGDPVLTSVTYNWCSSSFAFENALFVDNYQRRHNV